MLDRFIEILADEEEDVQCSAIKVLPWVLDILPPDLIQKNLIDKV